MTATWMQQWITRLTPGWLRPGPAATAPRTPATTARAQAPYDGGSTGTYRTSGWTPPDVGANVATASPSQLRARVRHAVRNDPWARNIVETFVDDVVGWGIKVASRAVDEALREALNARFEAWTAVADADGVLDFAGLQALAVRNFLVDGECFIRLHTRRPDAGLPVPLQVQVLPTEICPHDYTATTAQGHTILQGIEYDATGRRVAYWMYDRPPGDDDSTTASMTPRRVPAGQVLHLFEPSRPGQRRGVSALAPAILRLHELDRYTDATLLRLQLAAMFLAVKKATGNLEFDPMTGERNGDTVGDPSVLELRPGTIQELHPGEELTFTNPPDAPVGFDPFVKHSLRAAGAAVGVPLEVFTGDWGATNDRLARVVLNQYRRRVHRVLWTLVVPQVLRPIWQAWCTAAVTAPSFPAAPALLDPAARLVTFAPPAHPYVHPLQDIASAREAIRAGLTSRAAVVAETGEDVEIIDAQIAADNQRADRLGLRLDTDGRRPGGAQ